jgi:hypothetical protein
MTLLGNHDICALSAGRMWHLKSSEKKWKSTLKLRHYRFGDQGFRSAGLLSYGDSSVYFGEYFRNAEEGLVNIYKYNHETENWDITYTFPSGSIRHIHAIQKDSYTDKLWVCTGDLDRQTLIAWSNNAFASINILGENSQMWRTCHLVLTRDSVYWGTDSESHDHSGIYKFDRQTSHISKLTDVNGAIFYGTRLAGGTIVFSTNREGIKNENGDKTSLFILNPDDKISRVDFGTWHFKNPGFWFKNAILRFQRRQDGESLAVSVLNHKEFSDGELLIISEDELIKSLKN